VKVTEDPRQTGFAVGLIVILTGRIGFTTMLIELEVAGEPVVQLLLDVNIQFTISPPEGI